uniref:C2H2-type domain-containing protein n=1 Tax=Ciona savignyi TaxID=51511 RepID=H2ZKJ8_CIOSA
MTTKQFCEALLGTNWNSLDVYFYNCKDNVDSKCQLECKHNHCKFCDSIFYLTFKQRRHFFQCHYKKKVKCGDEVCFPCKLTHSEIKDSNRLHFHCPKCESVVFQRSRFVRHFVLHHAQKVKPTTSYSVPIVGKVHKKITKRGPGTTDSIPVKDKDRDKSPIKCNLPMPLKEKCEDSKKEMPSSLV